MSKEVALKESKSVSLFPNDAEWSMLKEQAAMAVKSGLLPQAVNTPEKAIAIALKGRELGIPPMQAFSHIHVIQGKPTISAELMLALVYKNCPGAVIDYVENTPKRCLISAKRPGAPARQFSFTIEEAKQAGLLNKDSWRHYPAAMLRARTVSIVARAVFADAIMGCSYTPEEMGAEVTDEGEVIETGKTPIYADQPEPIDGDADHIGEFRFRKGKFAKRGLKDAEEAFGLDEMRKWVDRNEKILAKARQENKVLDDQKLWEEDVEICARYIADRENGADVPFEQWEEERVT